MQLWEKGAGPTFKMAVLVVWLLFALISTIHWKVIIFTLSHSLPAKIPQGISWKPLVSARSGPSSPLRCRYPVSFALSPRSLSGFQPTFSFFKDPNLHVMIAFFDYLSIKLYFLILLGKPVGSSKGSRWSKQQNQCFTALARWLVWLEHPPTDQEVTGSVFGQDTYPGCGFDS